MKMEGQDDQAKKRQKRILMAGRLKFRLLRQVAQAGRFDVHKLIGVTLGIPLIKEVDWPDDAPSWELARQIEELWRSLEPFDEILGWRRGRGRPVKGEHRILELIAMAFPEHSQDECDHPDRYKQCLCNYLALIGDALYLRLSQFRTMTERKIRLKDEVKAAKIAVDRIWKEVHGVKFPKLKKGLLQDEAEAALQMVEIMNAPGDEVYKESIALASSALRRLEVHLDVDALCRHERAQV